ncbi:hypothetical protein BaRGS_00022074 [Batillaria attramentaria]|uniref:Uncharacterized protein n=1 Tax=Batillaria attramentaria TaxID=370345 RepID=A0ABD0KHW9_9CAEN
MPRVVSLVCTPTTLQFAPQLVAFCGSHSVKQNVCDPTFEGIHPVCKVSEISNTDTEQRKITEADIREEKKITEAKIQGNIQHRNLASAAKGHRGWPICKKYHGS